MTKYWLGKKRSPETIEKIRKSLLGKPNPNKGRKGWINAGSFKKGHLGLPGNQNPMWKGGQLIDEKGYKRISIGKKKYKTEHRLIMEEFLGRKLDFKEQVHHLNHIRQDNRIENLKIVTPQEHGAIHGKEALLSPLHPNNRHIIRVHIRDF